MTSWSRKTPTLIPISACVTNGPRRDSDAAALRALLRGAATFPPVLAWSGQRIPTGPNVMQSGQIPRPHSVQETYVSRSGWR